MSLYAFAYEHRHGAHERLDARHGQTSERFAVVTSDGRAIALYIDRRATRVRGPLSTATDMQFRRALAVAFAGCPSIQSRTRNLRYVQRELIRAITSYNECVGSPVALADPRAQRRVAEASLQAHVRAGVGGTSLYHPEHSRGSMQLMPFAALGLDLRPTASNPRFTLPLELAFRTYSVADGVLKSPYRTEDADRAGVVASVGVRYQLELGALRPSLGAGMMYGRLLGERRSQSWRMTEGGKVSLRGWAVPGHESGVFLESGLSSGRVSLALRWEVSAWGSVFPLKPWLGARHPDDVHANNLLGVVGFRL